MKQGVLFWEIIENKKQSRYLFIYFYEPLYSNSLPPDSDLSMQVQLISA